MRGKECEGSIPFTCDSCEYNLNELRFARLTMRHLVRLLGPFWYELYRATEALPR